MSQKSHFMFDIGPVKNTRCVKSINVTKIKLDYKESWAPFYLISTDSSIIYSPNINNGKVQSNIDEPYENYITCTCFSNEVTRVRYFVCICSLPSYPHESSKICYALKKTSHVRRPKVHCYKGFWEISKWQ